MTDEAWLDTVRIARDCGDISSLFPPGVKRLWDLPWTLHQAVRMALLFLSFEELPDEERPPKHIWLDTEKMKEHAAWVKRKRKAAAKGEDMSDMPQNDLMKEMFPGLKVPLD